MLKRAVVPLLRPRSLPLPYNIARSQFFRPQNRSYARATHRWNPTLQESKTPGNSAAHPESQTAASSASQEGPTLQQQHDPSSAPAPFGTDPERDLNDISDSVSKASKEDVNEPVKRVDSEEVSPEETWEQTQQLPDLTKGIPSTLEAELAQARRRKGSSPASLNITEDPAAEIAEGSGGRGGGDIPRTEYVSSSDRKKNQIVKYTYLILGLGVVGYSAYLGRNWDSQEEEKAHPEAPSGWGVTLFYNRIRARLGSNMSYYTDPVTTKLLPDEDPDPNLRYPFTLVLSLEDMLIHSEWTRERGWRIAKRPGVDYFLRYLSPYYEIVLFTSQPSAMTDQVLRKLDPYAIIRWPLFREATLYKDGGYIKDLSYLNRDLKKVIIIDTDPHHVKHQPENAIILPKWKGDPKDQSLVQLIPFLEYLATMGFDDARKVLQSFKGTHIPTEFAQREKRLREQWEAEQAGKGKKKRKSLGLGSVLGMSSQSHPDMLSASGDKWIWDQIRERGQRQYMEFDKKIREEGEKWLAERAAEEKAFQEEAMKKVTGGSMLGFFGWGSSDAGEAKK